MSHSSKSNGDGSDPRPWLEGQVYAPKRSRTADLVRRSVDALLDRGEEVSILSVVAMSKELDTRGVGVAHTSILRNAEARAYYEKHRAWSGPPRRPRADPEPAAVAGDVPTIRPDRDPDRARRRYLQLPKRVLVERLLASDQAYVMQREARLQAEEEILEWRLRAEAAEKRLAGLD